MILIKLSVRWADACVCVCVCIIRMIVCIVLILLFVIHSMNDSHITKLMGCEIYVLICYVFILFSV